MKDIHGYCQAISKLRQFFFEKKGFIEVPAQSRLSILAACEDPSTITKFQFGTEYPLPQTGQMWLEHELLKNPGLPGVFCVTTSYRNEPNPIAGRHEKIFPMFEFESKGSIDDMRQLEKELVEFLGFETPVIKQYEELSNYYGISELEAEHELKMQQDFGTSVSLEYFPERTSPFWNMKHFQGDLYSKIDVILYGMETIGSAERETDIDKMRKQFFAISGGQYAETLFKAFGEARVTAELDEYLALPMFDRFGAGIGVTRLVRAMRLAGLINEPKAVAA